MLPTQGGQLLCRQKITSPSPYPISLFLQ
jgi:hypothetical protein